MLARRGLPLRLRLPSRPRGFFTGHPQRSWTDRARTGWLTLWSPPAWLRRPVRAVRVAVLGVGIFEIGKARGHMEALQDPNELLEGMVKSLVAAQHHSSSGAEAKIYPRGSANQERVRSVGVRVLEAARAYVKAEQHKLETELEAAWRLPDAARAVELTAQVDQLKAAAKRLAGEWRWVVTNSETVNAFVTPYCPRHVFVHEGLLSTLTPTDDELAFLVAHEISHVIHAHAETTLDMAAKAAQLQLIVLSLIDPTGLLSLAATWYFGVWIDASFVKTHSRRAETEADDTGVRVVHLACYDSRGAGSMMAKLGAASGHIRSSWLDTHPLPPEREQSLERRAFALALEGVHEDCHSVRGLLRGLYARAAGSTGGGSGSTGGPAQ